MLRPLCALALFATPLLAQAPVDVPADSTHWGLQGQADVVDYQGKRSIHLDGGAAVLNNVDMRDAVIDVDVSTPAARGFFGIQFRLDTSGANGEWVYLRQHQSGYPDAMQYTPVLNTGANWQLYNGPGFTGAVDIPRNEWFHLRLEVSGAQAKLYVKDTVTPALVMTDLKSGIEKGQLALYVLTGATYFANFRIRQTADAPWVRHWPAMPAGTLVHWKISPSYDALARNLERPPSLADEDSMRWDAVDAEPPGIVALYRYRQAPHLHVTFQSDFSTRLQPQPGTKVLYARTTIQSDRDQVKKLYVGYSDDVSVFLNGRILYRGRSAQSFRDPRFLGIVNPENDAVYVPLKKGSNELVLAVSELGGGWGFNCRLVDVGN
ncbi:MAG TPA: hypothetical protein VN674_09875 [Gemmatimonadales bacterium]|nr:hypothetical protein [Gemmatimonadales bacterium]